MKQRKAPFVLITVLTLCLGTIAYVSVSYGKWTQAPSMPQQMPEEPVGESRKAPSAEQVASEVSASASRAKNNPGAPGGPEQMGGPGSAGQPTIYRPKAKPYRPQPSDSSIASGWYNDNYGGAGAK